MNRTILPLLLIYLFVTACAADDDVHEISPINFSEQNYTIYYGGWSSIHFYGGSGVYEPEVENSEVINQVAVDASTNSVLLFPAALGKSNVTLKDITTGQSATINVTVTNVHLYFRVDAIEGTNFNPYIAEDNEIRFIRTVDNRMSVKIFDNKSSSVKPVAEGVFDMTKDSDSFILEMSLHRDHNEEYELFRYSVKADFNAYELFDRLFNTPYAEPPIIRSHPLLPPVMVLTELNNGCKITATLINA